MDVNLKKKIYTPTYKSLFNKSLELHCLSFLSQIVHLYDASHELFITGCQKIPPCLFSSGFRLKQKQQKAIENLNRLRLF